MQKALNLLFIMLLIFPITMFAASQPQGTLNITITGFKNDNGVVRFAMFNSQTNYNTSGNTGNGAYFKTLASIHHGVASIAVPNLPYGTYAIKFFQDPDNSGKLKTNLFGKPTVGYGFSNNPSASKGPASYAQAKFNFNQKQVSMQLKVNN